MNASLAIWIPLLPLLSFLLIGIFGKKLPQQLSGIIGTLSIFCAALIGFFIAYDYFFISGKMGDTYQQVIALNHTWLQFNENLSIDMGIILDPISVMMIVVVTSISLMVHLYSIGYMHGEHRYSDYYAFLSLFSFSMLGLVIATNIFQTYVFWELVGVSSYLLIGFYYDKPSAVAASKKAFIVTRFADLGFLAGILFLSFKAETFDFVLLIERLTDTSSPYFTNIVAASFMGVSMLTWALTLIFIGGAGKSAMFPLHIWLPDAMEGPTPVSALIHAATMVVAGVYLVARLFPVFTMTPVALEIVAYTGAISSIIAAIIACTQTDIKRVLAYSTMSQIGYMMFALGVARFENEEALGYMASMFHLFTHAMFKALLFLGAGAVIHYVHSNEMKDMGGLRKQMPITHIVFLIACLAIAGVPPLSGFFSKEEILLAAQQQSTLIYGIGLVTAGLTSFYMFRLYFNIFWNKESTVESHGKEAPFTMILPLLLLAVASIGAGFVPFNDLVTATREYLALEFHITSAIVPISLSILGIVVAMILYRKSNDKPEKIMSSMGSLYKAAYQKFYIDELYLFVTKKIIFHLVSRPTAWFDRIVVNGIMNGIASTTEFLSDGIKTLQSGKLQHYAFYFFIGLMSLAFVIIYVFNQ